LSRLVAADRRAGLTARLGGPLLAIAIALTCALGLTLIRTGAPQPEIDVPDAHFMPPAPAAEAAPVAARHPDAIGQLLAARDAALSAAEPGPVEAAITGLREALAASAPDDATNARLQAELGLSEKYAGVMREDDTLLEKAIADGFAALEQFRRLGDRGNAAIVGANLIDALLAAKESQSGRLDKAQLIGIAETALSGIDRQSNALAWSRTQVKIGTLLLSAGAKGNDLDLVERAIDALRAGLIGADRDARAFTEWAENENLLGNALEFAADRTGSAARRREALIALRNAWLLYQLAGEDQYGFFFNARISALEARIADGPRPAATPAPVAADE
jgi:hypothetical protein